MERIPLEDRIDSKWERDLNDRRMKAAKLNATDDISEWLLAGMLDLDITDEEFIPLENKMYDRLRASTTRQELIKMVLDSLVKDASKLAEAKLKGIRAGQSLLDANEVNL